MPPSNLPLSSIRGNLAVLDVSHSNFVGELRDTIFDSPLEILCVFDMFVLCDIDGQEFSRYQHGGIYSRYVSRTNAAAARRIVRIHTMLSLYCLT